MGRMNSKMKLFLSLVLLLVSKVTVAEVFVFACEPEWAALAKEIGGDKLNVFSATSGRQDPHFIRARPSLIARARRADLLFCSGAELEIGWLPLLLRKASNPKILNQSTGYLMASNYVRLLDKPASVDRSLGEIHSMGNPHVHLNPYNLLIIGRELTKRLGIIDPDNKIYYKKRLSQFNERWQKNISMWEKKAELIKNKNYIVYHANWSYLADWLSINMKISVEPKPGIPPGTDHLSLLLKNIRDNNFEKIIYAANKNPKAVEWLSDKSGLPVKKLPFTVGGTAEADSLYNLFNETIKALIE